MNAHTDARMILTDAHHEPMGESVGLGVRLLVAPAAGRLRHLPPARFLDGQEWVEAGQAVALIEHGGVAIEVAAPMDARVVGILVRDGEPVQRGQPLVWLDDAPRRARPRGEGAGR